MGDSLTLYIGEKNISSWSMRAHVALGIKQLEFREQPISLVEDRDRAQRRRVSPTGRVPVLHHGRRVVPDSLAIVEYLEESFPPPRYPALWPADGDDRIHARWLAAAMHSGFASLRESMAFHRCFQEKRSEPTQGALADASEIFRLLESALESKHGDGPYLFGPIGAVDAFYAPVAVRLTAYGVTGTQTPRADAYLHDLLEHPAVRRWLDPARAMPAPPLA